MTSIKDRFGAWWIGWPRLRLPSGWCEVLVQPGWAVRHRDWCHRCGSVGIKTTGRMRVQLLEGARAIAKRTPSRAVPGSLDVPMCRRCRHGRWISAVFMILVALAGLTLGISKWPQVNDPAIAMPRWVQGLLGTVWLGAFFVFVAGNTWSRFHVVFDGVNLRYSFQDAWRAAGFASDNGTRVATADV